MKKISRIIIVLLLPIVLFGLTGCKNKEKKEVKIQTDGYKFAEEYTSINGTASSNGKTIRSLTISDDNPFVYATAEEVAEKIEKKDSFIVYFGFAKCPWCRSVLEQLIKAAKDKNIEKIYYVDVLEIRDTKEFDKEGNVIETKAGSEGYQKLLEQLEPLLEDYTLTKDEETIKIGEKRIYAPNVVAISRGKAMQLETGISNELTDPYGELTDEVKEYAYNKFKCLMECIEEESTTCQKNMC